MNNIPIDSIIVEDIYIHITTLLTNLIHVVYSTFEIANPPIITPDVGVIKFTRPLPALNIDITISGGNPNVLASGPKIGTDKLANPDVDGIKNANNIYIKNTILINNIKDIPVSDVDTSFNTYISKLVCDIIYDTPLDIPIIIATPTISDAPSIIYDTI